MRDADVAEISLDSVQAIWKAHGLVPHRVRTFRLSTNPNFISKLRGIVGLYMSPPAHNMVLSVDKKSRIQALDRTQFGLSMRPGQPATMTHDYIRHNTITLFAALNALDGTVVARCMQHHRHQEFLRFLNAVETAVPAGKLIHAIMNDYVIHKHLEVCAWLQRYSRWTFYFILTSDWWLNAVEVFFATLTERWLRRGSFSSLVQPQAAINRYPAEANTNSGPFVWTVEPDGIIEKMRRGYQASRSIY